MSSSSNGIGASKVVKEGRRGSVKKSSPPRTILAQNSISSPKPLRPSPPEPQTPRASSSKGKRKADEVEGNTPPDVKKQKATFAADPRSHRASGTSGSSHAPSSYTRKRARLSAADGLATTMASVGEGTGDGSRPPSRSNSHRQQNAGTTGTWSSSRSRGGGNNIYRTQSRTSQTHSTHPPSSQHQRGHSQGQASPSVRPGRALSRRGSLSQASIPISALVSPHAPSISHHRSTAFHMRDPRKPPKIQPTPWSLSLPEAGPGERWILAGCFHNMMASGRGAGVRLTRFVKKAFKGESTEKQEHLDGSDREPGTHGTLGWTEGGGSPLHAWLFFLGFMIFPVWWIAGLFVPVPKTRRIEGGKDGVVVLDDPQVEHDAKSWRLRCRVMAAVSLFTYVPFIVLVAVFVPRS